MEELPRCKRNILHLYQKKNKSVTDFLGYKLIIRGGDSYELP